MTGEFSAMPAGEPAESATPGWVERLGPRALERAAPRLGPVLAGAGALLAFFGLLTLSFDTSDVITGEGDSNNMIGFMLTAAGIAAGYALIVAFREGGLATFGSALAAMLIPFALFFLTWQDGDSPPFSVDVVLLLSVLVWLAAYVVGPSRGRPVFLGAAALGLWLFVLEQIESTFTLPFELLPFGFAAADVIGGGEQPSPPDAGTIGFVCLLFAAVYFTLAFVVDRRGWRGMVVPLVSIGFFALYTGFFAVQEDLEGAGAGILLAAAGVGIVFCATRLGRRGSAWFGAAAVALGVAWILGDIFEDADSITAPAVTLMIVGGLIALGADRWAAAINDPPEVDGLVPVGAGPGPYTAPGTSPSAPPPPPEPIDLE